MHGTALQRCLTILAAITGLLLLAGCDTGHISEGIGPFRSPAAVQRDAFAAARDPETDIVVFGPRLSPDGKTILFAVQYGRHPVKLAMMPADPKATGMHFIEAPPMMDWVDPAWAPDGKGFVAVSHCTRDDCYKGAKGYNIWRFYPRAKDNLQRITIDREDIRRNEPFFGKDADDLYWVVAKQFTPSENIHLDVNTRFVVHNNAGSEDILYPAHEPDSWTSSGLSIFTMHPAGLSGDGGIYFTSEVITIGSNNDPLLPAIKHMHSNSMSVLFRYEAGKVTLGNSEHVDAAAVSRSGAGYVFKRDEYVKHEDSGPVADFFVVRDGKEQNLFRFPHVAHGLSVSDDLSTVVFGGYRHFGREPSVWIFRTGDAAPVDLNVPERVKAEWNRQVELEKARAQPPVGAAPSQ